MERRTKSSPTKPDADPFSKKAKVQRLNAKTPTNPNPARIPLAFSLQPLAFPPAPEVREILLDLLEKCAAAEKLQFTLPDVLKIPPISKHGNLAEIARLFGGFEQLGLAVNQPQSLLYAA
jgi:type I restriction enzyme, R subunit